MRENEFEFGPVSKGCYLGLISLAALIPLYYPDMFLYYVLALIFLGLGLRPLLQRTGLYKLWAQVEISVSGRWNKKYLEKRRMEVDRKVRDEKYRHSRVKDPRLPKNW